MKYLFVLLALFSASAYAEQTMCIENNAGGMIHLINGASKIVISTNASGNIVKGNWELTDKSVMVKWESGRMSMFPKSEFKICEI